MLRASTALARAAVELIAIVTGLPRSVSGSPDTPGLEVATVLIVAAVAARALPSTPRLWRLGGEAG